ncbi:MAG: hypothetical protein ACRD0K_28345 [Egibacteraceae bacterium]
MAWNHLLRLYFRYTQIVMPLGGAVFAVVLKDGGLAVRASRVQTS